MTRECCRTAGLGEVFGEKRSKKDARRFRRKGLDPRARRLLDAVAAAGPLEGASSLEIGAGIGGLSLRLLERGVGRAVAVDAAPAAARIARELAEENGVADRFSMQVADFASPDPASLDPASLDPAERYDIVVLDRVVCCYPDWRGLLAPAAAATRRTLALTYPREAWYNNALVATINGLHALLRKEFRFHVHSPAAMLELLRGAGLRPRSIGRDGPWDLVVAQRRG